jgi:hypothetical protein
MSISAPSNIHAVALGIHTSVRNEQRKGNRPILGDLSGSPLLEDRPVKSLPNAKAPEPRFRGSDYTAELRPDTTAWGEGGDKPSPTKRTSFKDLAIPLWKSGISGQKPEIPGWIWRLPAWKPEIPDWICMLFIQKPEILFWIYSLLAWKPEILLQIYMLFVWKSEIPRWIYMLSVRKPEIPLWIYMLFRQKL